MMEALMRTSDGVKRLRESGDLRVLSLSVIAVMISQKFHQNAILSKYSGKVYWYISNDKFYARNR